MAGLAALALLRPEAPEIPPPPPADSVRPLPADTVPAAEALPSFVLEPRTDGVHTIQVPEGSTRTVVVTSGSFDVTIEVWRRVRRIDARGGRTEEAVLEDPGEWFVVIESADARGGPYDVTIGPGGSRRSYMLAHREYRRTHPVPVAPGETRTVTARSETFDPALVLFRRTARVDAGGKGDPEVASLDSGDWEMVVRSALLAEGGRYTLEVR